MPIGMIEITQDKLKLSIWLDHIQSNLRLRLSCIYI